MNYIKDIKVKLQKKLNLKKEYIGLLNEYTLLVLVTGKNTTLENVHDAWSVWQNKKNPEHKSLKSFSLLSKEVQNMDYKYRQAIVYVSNNL